MQHSHATRRFALGSIASAVVLGAGLLGGTSALAHHRRSRRAWLRGHFVVWHVCPRRHARTRAGQAERRHRQGAGPA